MNNQVTITISGPTGSGKSAIAGEIEILCKALGLTVEWDAGGSEKNLTGADWVSTLEMYKPSIRIVELASPKEAPAAPNADELAQQDYAAHAAWWNEIKGDDEFSLTTRNQSAAAYHQGRKDQRVALTQPTTVQQADQAYALKWCAAALQAVVASRGERGSISMFVSGEKKSLEEVLHIADAALKTAQTTALSGNQEAA